MSNKRAKSNKKQTEKGRKQNAITSRPNQEMKTSGVGQSKYKGTKMQKTSKSKTKSENITGCNQRDQKCEQSVSLTKLEQMGAENKGGGYGAS